MKHTPGPWEVSKDYSQLRVNGADGEAVAYTETCVGLERDQANARLIAAAPDLLDALEELLEIVLARSPEGFLSVYRLMTDKAQAAIKLAQL